MAHVVQLPWVYKLHVVPPSDTTLTNKHMKLAFILSLLLTNLLHSIRASEVSTDEDGYTLVGGSKRSTKKDKQQQRQSGSMSPKQVDQEQGAKQRRNSSFMSQTAAAASPTRCQQDKENDSGNTSSASLSSGESSTNPYDHKGLKNLESEGEWNAFYRTTRHIPGYNRKLFRHVGHNRVVMNQKYYKNKTNFGYDIVNNAVDPRSGIYVRSEDMKVLDLVQIAIFGFIDNEDLRLTPQNHRLSCFAPSKLHNELTGPRPTPRAQDWFNDFYCASWNGAGRQAHHMFDTMNVRLTPAGVVDTPLPSCAAYISDRYNPKKKRT